MKKIRIIGLMLLLMMILPLQAQDLIRGRVVDEATGEGIGFASVQYKGHNLVAITDPQGRFTIRLLKGKRLTISVLGYKTRHIDVSDDSEKMSHPNTYMQATATAYRSSSNDSLLLNQLGHHLAFGGSSVDKTIESILIDPAASVSTDFDVQFELIDCTTGMPLEEHIAPNTSCYLRVTNRTSELLYMNMLDIDRQGNKYLVLPMDAAATCAHLLVPAMSTVSFKKEPFVFGDEPSEETLLLMAVREPVDFSIVMDNIKTGGQSTMRVGLNRRFYQVK